jgi:hypothetical protein
MPGYYPTSHKSGKARIATALPTGSRKTLHPSDNRHCASSAKNTHENRVAAIQRKAKTAPMSVRHIHTPVCESNAGK